MSISPVKPSIVFNTSSSTSTSSISVTGFGTIIALSAENLPVATSFSSCSLSLFICKFSWSINSFASSLLSDLKANQGSSFLYSTDCEYKGENLFTVSSITFSFCKKVAADAISPIKISLFFLVFSMLLL